MTEAREGVSRRGFVKAFAAGAGAVNIATPAAAQQSAVTAEAPSFASNIVGTPSLPTGHHMQEEAPNEIYEHFIKFFTG